MSLFSELHYRGLCQGREKEIFPKNGRPSSYVKKVLCPECPVKQQCLDWALSSPYEPAGVWAGLDAAEVRALWMSQHPGANTDRVAGL